MTHSMAAVFIGDISELIPLIASGSRGAPRLERFPPGAGSNPARGLAIAIRIAGSARADSFPDSCSVDVANRLAD
jgi:hypothetical protein